MFKNVQIKLCFFTHVILSRDNPQFCVAKFSNSKMSCEILKNCSYMTG